MPLVPMSLTQQHLWQVATAFRKAIEEADRSQWEDYLRDFPRGTCGPVSELLADTCRRCSDANLSTFAVSGTPLIFRRMPGWFVTDLLSTSRPINFVSRPSLSRVKAFGMANGSKSQGGTHRHGRTMASLSLARMGQNRG